MRLNWNRPCFSFVKGRKLADCLGFYDRKELFNPTEGADELFGFLEGFVVFFLVEKSVWHIVVEAKFAAMPGFFHGLLEVNGLGVWHGCVGGAVQDEGGGHGGLQVVEGADLHGEFAEVSCATTCVEGRVE